MTDAEPKIESGQEQRKNFAIREVSQIAFAGLLDTLETQGLTDMVKNLRGMGQVEKVMRKSPAMVGMLVSLAWKFREAPLLAGLFTTPEGHVAAQETEPMGPCGRSFADIRKSHLLGTARLFLTQRPEGKTIAKAGNPGLLQKFLGLFKRKAAPVKNDLGSLYQALKPHLRHQGQFELIPSYAAMPLRQISLLGGLLPALLSTEAVIAVSTLPAGPSKALLKLCRQFATTVLARSDLTPRYVAATTLFVGNGNGAIDDAVAGYALNKLLTDYNDVVPSIVTDEDAALDLVRRLAPTVGIDLWSIFRQPTQAVNIRFCPEPIAQVLGISAGMIHEAISSSLSAAKNLDAMGLILAEILKDMGAEKFERIVNTLEHVKLWDSVVANVNRADNLDSGADLTLPKNAASLQSVATLALRSFQSAGSPVAAAKAA